MKYFKILLIPIITFMFMVPIKANETPDWVYTEHYYLVTQHNDSGSLAVQIFSTKNNIIKSGNNYYVPTSSFIAAYRLSSVSNTWESYGNSVSIKVDGIQYRLINSYESDGTIVYSNFDLVVNGNLVFPKTPVVNLAMVTQKAVETLEMEVQGTSGRISLVGGAILGLLLVPVLVSRFRHWARV